MSFPLQIPSHVGIDEYGNPQHIPMLWFSNKIDTMSFTYGDVCIMNDMNDSKGCFADVVWLCMQKCVVHLPGGPLEIEWREEDNHVYMTGPAELVFKGKAVM